MDVFHVFSCLAFTSIESAVKAIVVTNTIIDINSANPIRRFMSIN